MKKSASTGLILAVTFFCTALSLPMLARALDKQPSKSMTGFDVNDVTIIFPLNNKIVVPEVTFKNLITEVEFNEMSAAVYKLVEPRGSDNTFNNWRITGLRIDPCFPTSKTDPTCIQQIRLTAQSVKPQWGFSDQSIHLLYKMDHKQFSAATKILNEIKSQSTAIGASTSGRALQPHPGLTKEIASKATDKPGSISLKIKNLIAQLCSTENLMATTMIGSDDSLFQFWIFMGGDIKDGHWIAHAIPNIDTTRLEDSGDQVMSDEAFKSGFVQGSDGLSTGFPLPPASSAKLLTMRTVFEKRSDEDSKKDLSAEDIEGLYTIANPKRSNPTNTDCMSCHLNSEYLRRNLNTGKQEPKTMYTNPLGVTGFAESKYSPLFGSDDSQIRVIGYAEDRLFIAPMLANSSAEVASILNRTMGLANPNQHNCQSPDVFNCFNQLGKWAKDTKSGTEAYCLKLCQ